MMESRHPPLIRFLSFSSMARKKLFFLGPPSAFSSSPFRHPAKKKGKSFSRGEEESKEEFSRPDLGLLRERRRKGICGIKFPPSRMHTPRPHLLLLRAFFLCHRSKRCLRASLCCNEKGKKRNQSYEAAVLPIFCFKGMGKVQ